jgi:hypothetical protein
VGDSVVLVFTGNDEALVSEWVKRVCDRDFACQNSGTMNCLPILEDNGLQPSTVLSALPSSTGSIRRSIFVRCSINSPSIPSIESTNFCPGTSRPQS